MKIICHLGLPKTGTTSLQHALHGMRDRLRERGVLYPDGGAARETHQLLTPLYKPEELVSPGLKYMFGHDASRMRRAADDLWAAIRRDVAQNRPKLLVLSSEFFFIYSDRPAFERFFDLLSELSDDITPVLYVREAASLYGSIAQQCIKNGRPVEPLRGEHLETGMPAFEAAFGRAIVVRSAQRDKLVDGDILADFMAGFVTPEVGAVPATPVRMNESVSAEVLAILDRYRRLRYPEPARLMPDHYSLRRILERLEAESGDQVSAPRLRPEFAEAVRRSSVDMLWLRDRNGIEFAGVNYGAIDGAPPEIDPTVAAVEEIFEVDPARRDALQAEAMAQALEGWRALERMPRLTRAVGAAGGGLLTRLKRRRA